MTSVDVGVLPVRSADDEGVRRSWLFGHLVRKELRESAGAIIAGLSIYWIMPALLELSYIACDPHHELLPGFGWGLILATGWLYAVVVGAQTVCRDWGRPEEHFLLGRPVTPRTVVWAKLLAGVAVVAGVALVCCLWDWLLPAVFSGPQARMADADGRYSWVWLVLGCVLAVSFVTAFATAVMTRQMLPSILVPSLLLLLWSTAPLISRHLTFLGPAQIYDPSLWSGGHASTLSDAEVPTNVPFVLLACVWTAAAAVTALLTCTRERLIRLGHKPLAWATAVAVIVLFSLAMNEVGNSLTVRDHCTLLGRDAGIGIVGPDSHDVASCGNHFVFLSTIYGSASNAYVPYRRDETASYGDRASHLTAFRIDDEGRVCGARRTSLGSLHSDEDLRFASPDGHRRPEARCPFSELLRWSFLTRIVVLDDPEAHILMGGVVGDTVRRLRLVWPEDGKLEILSEASVSLPSGEELDYPAKHLMTARYSYLTQRVRSTEPPSSEGGREAYLRRRVLRVVDWSDEARPQMRYSIPLPAGTTICQRQRYLAFIRPTSDKDWEIDAVPIDNPDVLAELQAHPTNLFRPVPNAWWRAVQPFRVGELQRIRTHHPLAWALGSNGVLYVSDELGIRAFGPEESGTRRLIGEYWRSPFSMLSHNGPWQLWSWRSWSWEMWNDECGLQINDNSLLIEPGLFTYDVSDPARLQRTGFFNALPSAQIIATPNHLVLLEYSLVTVVDRPRP